MERVIKLWLFFTIHKIEISLPTQMCFFNPLKMRCNSTAIYHWNRELHFLDFLTNISLKLSPIAYIRRVFGYVVITIAFRQFECWARTLIWLQRNLGNHALKFTSLMQLKILDLSNYPCSKIYFNFVSFALVSNKMCLFSA